jgi:hypothetical protein
LARFHCQTPRRSTVHPIRWLGRFASPEQQSVPLPRSPPRHFTWRLAAPIIMDTHIITEIRIITVLVIITIIIGAITGDTTNSNDEHSLAGLLNPAGRNWITFACAG